jgi:hypothetical protein
VRLFQHDKKIWDEGVISHTWQFGIIKNRSLLWVNYEDPTAQGWSTGGLHAVLSLFSNSLFGVELYNERQSFSFYTFSEYFSGWNQ